MAARNLTPTPILHVQALRKAGVIERTEDGRILFPYDAVHVDFVLRAA